jgi:hypothetical protein
MRSAAALEMSARTRVELGRARKEPRGLGRLRAKNRVGWGACAQRYSGRMGRRNLLKTLAVAKSVLTATILCAQADFSRN